MTKSLWYRGEHDVNDQIWMEMSHFLTFFAFFSAFSGIKPGTFEVRLIVLLFPAADEEDTFPLNGAFELCLLFWKSDSSGDRFCD